jgi:hypothetical protein
VTRPRRLTVPTSLRAALAIAAVLLLPATARAAAASARVFSTPDEAVRALIDLARKNDVDGLAALFGAAGQDLLDTSDEATGRRNRQVFGAAVKEGWRLQDAGRNRKELVIGNESWPFPVPLVKGPAGWSFDAAAGHEEVLNRRIGRNELAVIRVLNDYVAAQRAYAVSGHDGKPPGLYARRFGSSAGKQDGLYWPTRRGEPRSPLGVLVAQASSEGYHRRDGEGPSPLYGYYFRILEGQGPSAKGGAVEYVVNDEMKGGFALVAWPVYYGASGVMTFVVNQEGVPYEKDLGAETQAAAEKITRYDADSTWHAVQADVKPPGH